MVACEAPIALAALSNSTASSPSAKKLMSMDNKPNFSREVNLSGLDLEKQPRLRWRRDFFLDIPFYRTH
jgi:hypothetical protein